MSTFFALRACQHAVHQLYLNFSSIPLNCKLRIMRDSEWSMYEDELMTWRLHDRCASDRGIAINELNKARKTLLEVQNVYCAE